MTQDLSPWTKFWYHGVDIMVNASSALLVAGVVGVAWFLKREIEYWFEQRRDAEREIKPILNRFFEVRACLIQGRGEEKTWVREIDEMFLTHRELNGPEGFRFFSKWFADGDIYVVFSAVTPSDICSNTWKEFIHDLCNLEPTPRYPKFPLKRMARSLLRQLRVGPMNAEIRNLFRSHKRRGAASGDDKG